MDINKYSVYSAVSVNGNKSKDSLDKLLKVVDDFEKLKNSNEAKEYLKENLKIKDSVQNYPLGGNSFMSVIENTEFYMVRFEYADECMTFSYNKSSEV